jgi:pteridine reductase
MNKTILITGAAKRIGKEIALTYCDMGWNIIIHYNSSKNDAEKLANEINSKNPESAKIIQANLDISSDVQKLINESRDEISDEHWEKLVGSNLKGPLFLIQGLSDKLKESKGSIINITDTNLSKGVANFSIYAAAKGGLESITKVLARELAPEVNVNAIAPGAMLEPPDVTWTEEQKEKVISNIPLKRMGNEKDIANAVKFVASSKYMTGQIIKVDGGRSLS